MTRWHLRRLYRRCGWVLPVAVAVAFAGGAVTLTERGGPPMADGAGLVSRKDPPEPRSVSVATLTERGEPGAGVAQQVRAPVVSMREVAGSSPAVGDGVSARPGPRSLNVAYHSRRYRVNWRRRYHAEHAHVQRLLRQLERARHVQAHAPVATDWRARQIAAAETLGREADAAGTDPWPNCPDPYDHAGASWDDTVACENSGSWLDSPGYFRCGLQFEPMWERRFGELCP